MTFWFRHCEVLKKLWQSATLDEITTLLTPSHQLAHLLKIFTEYFINALPRNNGLLSEDGSLYYILTI